MLTTEIWRIIDQIEMILINLYDFVLLAIMPFIPDDETTIGIYVLALKNIYASS